MYDELVKRLRETSCGAKDTLWWQAADAIEKLQKSVLRLEEESGILDELPMYQQPVGWIPVTERLPENGYYVLVYEDGDIMMASYSGGEWCLRDMYEIIELKPTHWQPLPQPPEEGS